MTTTTTSRDDLFTLGLLPGATKKEIKTAFQKLSLRMHPDKNANLTHIEDIQHMQLSYENLKKAYESLMMLYENHDEISDDEIIEKQDHNSKSSASSSSSSSNASTPVNSPSGSTLSVSGYVYDSKELDSYASVWKKQKKHPKTKK